MSEGNKRTVVTLRESEAVRVEGPARVEIVRVTDHRVRVAVVAAPTVAVVREASNG